MRKGSVFVSPVAAGAIGLFTVLANPAAAGPGYTLVGSYALPAGTSVFDLLPDGRAIALVGGELRAQAAPNSTSFSTIGAFNPSLLNSFGPSFLRVSPGGTRIAIGDGNFGGTANVLLLDSAALNPSAPSTAAIIPSANFDGRWLDESTLFVSGATFGDSLVNRIDAASLTSSTVIAGIGGGSGGVAFRGGSLITGAGFDFDPGVGVETGDLRAFDLAALSGSGAALDFASAGAPLGRVLSAASLGFDDLGNLLVGGGDFSGENGFAAVIDGLRVSEAFSGGPLVSSADGQQLAPAGPQYYGITSSAATGELLVRAFGTDTIYRYAVPAPAGAVMLISSLVWGSRRRRA